MCLPFELSSFEARCVQYSVSTSDLTSLELGVNVGKHCDCHCLVTVRLWCNQDNLTKKFTG